MLSAFGIFRAKDELCDLNLMNADWRARLEDSKLLFPTLILEREERKSVEKKRRHQMNFDERFTCLKILEKKKKKNMEGGNECVCTHKKKRL